MESFAVSLKQISAQIDEHTYRYAAFGSWSTLTASSMAAYILASAAVSSRSTILRFEPDATLEQLILRHSLGLSLDGATGIQNPIDMSTDISRWHWDFTIVISSGG